MRTLQIALFAMLALAGCNGAATEMEVEEEEPPELVSFDLLGAGQRGSLSDTLETAIREPEMWEAVQDSLRPLADFRPVDFTTEAVLLVALPQPNSGYSIDLTAVENRDTVLVASYTVNAPGEDCLAASALSVPFVAARIPRQDLPVRFERTVEEYSCGVLQR